MTLQADHGSAVTIATLVVLAMFLLGSPPPVAADAKLVITSAVVDFDFIPPRITVFGDFSEKFGEVELVVTLDGEPLEVVLPLASQIVAELPVDVAAGAHRVAVCRVDDDEEDDGKDDDKGCPEKVSKKDQKFNVLDVTFGAVGPIGPEGPKGDTGDTGEKGAPGAPGAPGQSCEVTDCSAEGVATITCGASEVRIACIPPALPFTTFSDQASFLAAAGPGLAFEDFEGILQGGGFLRLPTLSSTTNAPPNVSPGDIPPGVVFSAPIEGVAVLKPGAFGIGSTIPSDSLLAASSVEVLIADFSPGVTAVGSDLFNSPSPADIVVSVMDASGGLQNFFLPTFSSTYFGVIASGGEITQIQWAHTPGATFTMIDNIHFGQGVP